MVQCENAISVVHTKNATILLVVPDKYNYRTHIRNF